MNGAINHHSSKSVSDPVVSSSLNRDDDTTIVSESERKAAKMQRMLNNNNHLRIIPEIMMMLLMLMEKKKKEEEAKLKNTVSEAQNDLVNQMEKKMQLLTKSLSSKLISSNEKKKEEASDELQFSELVNGVFNRHLSQMFSIDGRNHFIEKSKQSVNNLMKNQSKKILERMALESELLMWVEGRKSSLEERVDQELEEISDSTHSEEDELPSMPHTYSRLDRLESLDQSDSALNEFLRYRQDLALKDVSKKLSVIQKEEEDLMHSGTEYLDTSASCLQDAKEHVKQFVEGLSVNSASEFQMNAAFRLSYQTLLQNLDKMTDMNLKLKEKMNNREKAITSKNRILLKVIKREEVISHKIQQEVMIVQQQYQQYVADIKREEKRREIELRTRNDLENTSSSAPVVRVEPRTQTPTTSLHENHERERQLLLFIIQEKEDKIIELYKRLKKSSYHINPNTTLVKHKKAHFMNEARRNSMQTVTYIADDKSIINVESGISHQDAVDNFLKQKNSSQDDQVYSVSTLFHKIDRLKTENSQLRNKIIDLQQHFISYMEQVQTKEQSANNEAVKLSVRRRSIIRSTKHIWTQTSPRKHQTLGDNSLYISEEMRRERLMTAKKVRDQITEDDLNVQNKKRRKSTRRKSNKEDTNSQSVILTSSETGERDPEVAMIDATLITSEDESSDTDNEEEAEQHSSKQGKFNDTKEKENLENKTSTPVRSMRERMVRRPLDPSTKESTNNLNVAKSLISVLRTFIQGASQCEISADVVGFMRMLHSYLVALRRQLSSIVESDMKEQFPGLLPIVSQMQNVIKSSNRAIFNLGVPDKKPVKQEPVDESIPPNHIREELSSPDKMDSLSTRLLMEPIVQSNLHLVSQVSNSISNSDTAPQMLSTTTRDQELVQSILSSDDGDRENKVANLIARNRYLTDQLALLSSFFASSEGKDQNSEHDNVDSDNPNRPHALRKDLDNFRSHGKQNFQIPNAGNTIKSNPRHNKPSTPYPSTIFPQQKDTFKKQRLKGNLTSGKIQNDVPRSMSKREEHKDSPSHVIWSVGSIERGNVSLDRSRTPTPSQEKTIPSTSQLHVLNKESHSSNLQSNNQQGFKKPYLKNQVYSDLEGTSENVEKIDAQHRSSKERLIEISEGASLEGDFNIQPGASHRSNLRKQRNLLPFKANKRERSPSGNQDNDNHKQTSQGSNDEIESSSSILDVIRRLTDSSSQAKWNKKREIYMHEQEEKLLKMLGQYLEPDDQFIINLNRIGQRKLHATRRSPERNRDHQDLVLDSFEVQNRSESRQTGDHSLDKRPTKREWLRKRVGTQSDWDLDDDSPDYSRVLKNHPPVLIHRKLENFNIPKGFFLKSTVYPPIESNNSITLSINGTQDSSTLLEQIEHEFPIERGRKTKLPSIFKFPGEDDPPRRIHSSLHNRSNGTDVDLLMRSVSVPLIENKCEKMDNNQVELNS